MRAENKETIINERGRTEDIISCVVDTYNLYWRKCEHTAKKLQSSNVLLTCSNIIDFVLDNIRYELDPEGKQWVKTPARLLEDGKGDCKSYSILVCSFLSCLGIRNCFRFVSYHKGDYTHVYSVAFDEDGKEIVIDCVAMQTANVKRFAEVKYRKKLDVMNTTEISRLSGIGGGYNPTFAKVLANSCLIKAQAIGDYIETAMYLNWIVDNVKSEEELRICAYTFGLWCYGFVTDKEDDTKRMSFNTLCGLTQDFFVGLTNPAAPQPQPYSWDEQQKAYDWFVANIIDNWKVLQNPDPTATKDNYFHPLYECAPMFLYLFAPSKSLNAKTKKKRDNAVKIVTALCAGRAITLEAAMNAIYAAIVKQFGMTPSEVLHTLFPKKFPDYIKLDKARVVAIGAAKYEFDEIAPPSDNVTQLPPDYYESTPAQKVSIIEKILGGVVGAFTKVWGAVTGQTGSAQVYYQNTTPSQNDYSGMISTVAVAVLAVGAFFVFKNKKKKKMMEKRAYIGDTAVDLESRIFSIGVPYWRLRLSQTTLFSQLTLLQTKIKFAKSVEEVEGYYSQQDMIFAIYKLVETFGNNEQYLRDSARAVKYYAENGYFSEEFDSMDERNAHLNKTINKMIEDVSSQTVYVETLTPDEVAYWEQQIMSKNYYTDPQTGEHLQNVRQNTIAIMGDDDFFKDLQTKFHDSANAWVYTMVPASKVEKYKKAKIKRAKLNATRNSLMALDVTLDYDTQNALLESGIMENGDFGQNADTFIDYMIVTAQEEQKKSASIGDFGVSAIVSLVVAILSTVAAIVPAIIVAVQNKRARENNEKYQEALGGINGAQQNIASTGDFFTAVREFFSGTGGLLFFGATALLALYYFS